MRKRALTGLIFLFVVGFASPLWAQSGASVQYIHDPLGRLTTVVDPSGNVATYNYDAVGNLLSITRSTSSPSALAILGFSPAQGSVGQTVAIQGQNFSATPSANTVKFNGTAATVTAATTNSLTVSVPTGATTGPISVTVGTATVTSSNNFTVLSVPVITSVSPALALNTPTISSFQVTGTNLTAATFSFLPTFSPRPITISNVVINSNGTSATMTLTLASNALGSFTLVATNSFGSSTSISSASNALTIVSSDPNADFDGDGLTNIYEAAIATNYANPSTAGDGLPDGWAVFYGLNPLNPSAAGQTAPNGLTYLQSFQSGLNPLIPNLVPPAVSNVFPANGATNYPTNGVIVVRFTEPLLAGVDLTTAQRAINAALPAQANFSATNALAAAQVLQAYLQRTCCGTTAIPGVVQILQNGRPVAGGVSLSNDRLSITFAPALNLSSSTTYTVVAQGVRDAAGNLMTQSFQSTFTTGLSANKTRPGAVFTNPPNGATGVETNAPVRMEFSNPVNPATLTAQTFFITDTFTALAVPGTLQVDPFGFTASFVPAQPYGVGRKFNVTLTTGIQDVNGNSFPGSSFFFTTGFAADSQGFNLIGTSPSNGATGVPLNSLVVLEFDEPIDEISALTGLQVQLAGAPISGAIALSDGNKRVTFTPTLPLVANSTYSVVTTGRLTDFAGNPLSNPDSSFFTSGAASDTTRLQVINVSPASGATGVPTNAVVQLQFNKQANALTLTDSTLLFSGFGTPAVAKNIALSPDGLTATLTPTNPLLSSTVYSVAVPVGGITDLQGQVIQSGFSSFFTTGTGPATNRPTVLTVVPPTGATGVPVNARVEVVLSAAVSVTSVGSNAITVSAGGTQVAGAIIVSSDRTTLIFTPSSLLAVSTTYTVNVSGLVDQAGNAVVPFTSSFATGTSGVADTTRATVATVSPTNGATGVAVNSNVVLTFNKIVDPTTVNSSTVPISVSGFTGVLAGSYVVNGTTVTFTPVSPLPGSVTVQVGVNFNTVFDFAGNGSNSFSSSFTTAAVADTTAPQVILVTPGNGSTGVALNSKVVLTFSKSLNANTVNFNTFALLANGTNLRPSVSRSADNRVVTLDVGTLPASSTVTVVATRNVTDLSGNALPDFESQFATGPGLDFTNPSVLSQRPGNGATGVPVNASVVLYLNEPMNMATIPGALHISQNGVLLSGTTQATDSGQVIQFSPSVPLQNGALIQVFLDTTAQDTDGKSLSNYQASFTTVSDPNTTAPTPVSSSPSNGATAIPTNAVLQVAYSEVLDPNTVNSTTVSLTQSGGAAVPSAVSLVSGGLIIQISPNAPLAANTTYLCQIGTGIRGVNGLTASTTFSASFTTGVGTDTVSPTVVLVSPPDGFLNVGDNANIRVRFSKPINPLTASGNSIVVTTANGVTVPTTISFSNNNQDVLAVPNVPLPDNTQITLTVSGISDLAGNAAAPKTTHFTTGTGPDTTSPVALYANPFSGASNVPLNTNIMLQISEPVDPGSVNSNSFTLFDDQMGQPVTGSYSVSADGRTITFVPSALLAGDRLYSVLFTDLVTYIGNITDLAGNQLNQLANPAIRSYDFITGNAVNTVGPQVVGVSPSAGLTGVAINAQVVIQFNKPIDALTVNQVTLSGNGTVNVTRTLSNGNLNLILVPLVPLNTNTTYTVTVTGVQDLSGNLQSAPVTTGFTTGAGADLTPPTAIGISPASGATGVPTNTVIQLKFSKRIDPLTLNNSTFAVFPNSAQGFPIAGSISVSADGLTTTFSPARPLVPGTTYTIQCFAVTDLQGLLLQFFSSNFTTGLTLVTTSPTVVTVSPPNGTAGAPVNARVDVVMSAPVAVASVGTNAITVSASGNATPGAIGLSSDGTTLTFTPSSLLAVSTVYTVNVSGFTDQAGNTVVPFTSSFSTGTSGVADTSRPTVVSVSPAQGTIGVPVNSTIVLTFNKNIDPSTVNSSTVAISDTALFAVLAGSYAVNGTVVTFTPVSPLPGSATVGVLVNGNGGVLDLAGNGINVAFSSSFTTAAATDTTAPQVVAVTPNNGAAGIGLNATVALMFSKSLNPNTINASTFGLLANGTKLNVPLSRSTDNRVVTLSAGTLLASSTIAVLATSGVTDLSGNSLGNFESQFTTAAATDTTHPSVINQRPDIGAEQAPSNAIVVLYVNEAMNTATIPGALHITQNGIVLTGTTQVTNNGQVIQFTPSAPFQGNALIQVFLDSTALDVDGNSLANYQGGFVTAPGTSTAGPNVVDTNPGFVSGVPTNVVIGILFDQTLNAATVNTTTVSLLQGGSTLVPSTVSTVGGGTIIQVKPSALLMASTSYSVQITTGVQGTNGQPFAFTGNVLSFTTGAGTDTTNPAVVLVSPPNGSVNVGDNASIRVRFSKALNPLSVNSGTILISGGSVTQVPYDLSFTSSQEVLIVPYAPLPDATQMAVAISGVTDVAGNAVLPQTTHFTTRTGADLTTPVVVNTNPFNLAMSVPLNAVVILQANKPLDPGTVSSNTLLITDNVTRQTVASSCSVSTDGQTISCVPTALLTASRSYTVSYSGLGIMDLVGNPLFGQAFSFTTGTASSTAGPQVIGVSPVNGLVGVPINAQVLIQFNEPVDAITLNQVTLSAGGAVTVTPMLSNGNQTLILVPVAPLNPGTSYTVTITGVQDMSGNSLSSPVTTSFTTGTGADLTPPTALSVSPPSGTTGVLTNSVIQLRFSKRIDPFTVTNSTFFVFPSSTGQHIAGTIMVSTDGLTATLTPAVPLAVSTSYLLEATSGITDLEGQPLVFFSSSFTTGTQ